MFLIVNSDEKLYIPLLCFPEPKLNSSAFLSSEVKKLLLDLILLEPLNLMVFLHCFLFFL